MPHSEDYDGKRKEGKMTGFEDRNKSVPKRDHTPRERGNMTNTGGQEKKSD